MWWLVGAPGDRCSGPRLWLALEKGAQVMSQGPFLGELVQAEVCRAEQPEPAEPVLPGGGKHHPRQTWVRSSCAEHHWTSAKLQALMVALKQKAMSACTPPSWHLTPLSWDKNTTLHQSQHLGSRVLVRFSGPSPIWLPQCIAGKCSPIS